MQSYKKCPQNPAYVYNGLGDLTFGFGFTAVSGFILLFYRSYGYNLQILHFEHLTFLLSQHLHARITPFSKFLHLHFLAITFYFGFENE